jgi:hypothetical protein
MLPSAPKDVSGLFWALGYLNVYFVDLKPHFEYRYFGYFNAYRGFNSQFRNLNFGDLNSDFRYMHLDLRNSDVHFLNGLEYFGYLNLKIPNGLLYFLPYPLIQIRQAPSSSARGPRKPGTASEAC